MNVTLLIPDLIPPRGAQGNSLGVTHWSSLDTPCLKRLLARARWTRNVAPDTQSWLKKQFNVDALGPVMAQADGLAATQGYWLNATPVHVEARRTSLVLTDPAHLQLDPEEAAALAAPLTLHLAGEGLALYAPHPARWYIRSENLLTMSDAPPHTAAGRDIQSFTSNKAAQRLLTELQMLLHAHPVNTARAARGAPAVNHLWLWDGGAMPARTPAPYRQVHGNDFTVQALAAHADVPRTAAPARIGARTLTEGSHLLTTEILQTTLRRDGPDAWRAAVAHLEQDWLQPLVALKPATLTLVTSAVQGLQQFVARPRDKYKIFNKNNYL
jgi:hypothetical protein